MMLGPIGNTSVSVDDRLVTGFGVLAALTGVATLIQVRRKTRSTQNAATIRVHSLSHACFLSTSSQGRNKIVLLPLPFLPIVFV